jgi:hypothetical protein
MVSKIFITGCARSGTTLFNRMFLAFGNVDVIDQEMTLYKLSKMDSTKVLVRKRNSAHIFSQEYRFLSDAQIDKQKAILRRGDIFVINMVRDGRDVITSGYASVKRWLDSITQAIVWARLINMTVRYEDLIRKPNDVQTAIVKRCGLKRIRLFSEYPDFVSSNFIDKNTTSNYKLRKLDLKNIGKQPDLYKDLCNYQQKKKFEDYLRTFNYA